MRKIFAALLLAALVQTPGFASEKTEPFEYFETVLEKNPETAAMHLADGLNKTTRGKLSIDQINDDGDYTLGEGPLMLSNFKIFLQRLRAKGYGSGTFERWNFVYIKNMCGEPEIVLYSRVLHGGKAVTFGFRRSVGESLVSPQEFANKKLTYGCGPD